MADLPAFSAPRGALRRPRTNYLCLECGHEWRSIPLDEYEEWVRMLNRCQQCYSEDVIREDSCV